MDSDAERQKFQLGLARKFDPLFHEALECCFNSHRPVQLITGQIRTKDPYVRHADHLGAQRQRVEMGDGRSLVSQGEHRINA
jgi:hypothetical protein